MSVFGWCSGPEGAKPQHKKCIKSFTRVGGAKLICDCVCHKAKEPAKKKVVKRKG